jgi:hypothetical protein
MLFRAQLLQLNFDEAGFKKKLDERLKAGTRQAAREWLRATLERVPVYTGTARGTLLPLSRVLRVALPISPIASRPNRGPEVGAQQSDYEFLDGRNGVYGFSFLQGLEYYILNDANLVSFIPSTPWHSFDAGKEAYDEHIGEVIDSLPKITDFVRSSVIHG